MSIVADGASVLAAASEPITPLHTATAVMMILASCAAAVLLRVFRAGSVSGPARLAPTTSVAGIFMLLAVTVFAWLGTQMIYFGMIRRRLPMDGHGRVDVSMLAPGDMAFLGTVPALLGLVVLMMGGRVVKPSLPRELGWTIDRLLAGLWRGLVAMLCVMPLMFGSIVFLQLLYQFVGYEHPSEHEMLTVLGKTEHELTKLIIVGGATVLVPVFEEFLFRGHLQTVLARLFAPRPPRRQTALGFAVVQRDAAAAAATDAPLAATNAPLAAADGPLAPPVSVVTPPPIPPPPPPPLECETLRDASPAGKWAAIAITSIVFAVLHPGWTWPLIFLLSLALGYAYERTGNLWVPVVMHVTFNSVQTAMFLVLRSL